MERGWDRRGDKRETGCLRSLYLLEVRRGQEWGNVEHAEYLGLSLPPRAGKQIDPLRRIK